MARFLALRASVHSRGKGDHVDVDVTSGRMFMRPGEEVRLALVTKRGKETVCYLTEPERIGLIRGLLKEGEVVAGLPTE